MIRVLKTLIVIGFLVTAIPAFAASTINPTVPAPNAPMASAPIRGNFQAGYNDINNILSKFGSSLTPYQPSTRQDWFDTTGTPWNWKLYDGSQWVSIGTLNASTHTWTAAPGGSVTTFSGGTTGLTPNSATAGAITLDGVLVGANGGTGVANTGKTITLGGNVLTAAALTTTGTSATTLAFPSSGTPTFTFPTTSKTLMASDYSNGSSLTANALLTGGGAGIPNAVAITGLVLGNGVSAPTAYGGTSSAGNVLTALSAAGAGTFQAFGLTGNSTLVETTSGGLLTASLLPAATSSTFGGVKPDGTTITNSTGAISVTYGTSSTSAARGDLAAPLASPTFTGTATFPGGLTISSAGILAAPFIQITGGGISFNVTSGSVSLGAYISCTALTTNGTGLVGCTASDERMKNDLGPIDPKAAIAALSALNAHSYTYKDPMNDIGALSGTHYGFFAQDVQTVFPNMVRQGPVTASVPAGELQFDKDELVAWLWTQNQAMNAQIQALQTEVTALQQKVSP